MLELYIGANAMQRAAIIKALELTTKSSFVRISREDQQILELGCGSGNFTRQDLLPRCQPCRRIVATDVSEEMVHFARQNFPHPQMEHDGHDLRAGASKLVKKYGEFDRVYSFFAVHYAQDQASALRNVSYPMTVDRERLLVFVARIPGFDIWRRVLGLDRWKSSAEAVPTTRNMMFLPFANFSRYLASRAVPTLMLELYIGANAMQRAAIMKALELTTKSSFVRISREDQQILELGCGSGNFTRQDLLPRCQPCRRIVATDVSEEMVHFARQNFPHPQMEHDGHDLRAGASKLVKKYGEFDRVYSFFAVHYAQDQASALRNVSYPMTVDRERLLVFVARIPGFDIWRRVLGLDRWKSSAEAVPPHSPSRKPGRKTTASERRAREDAALGKARSSAPRGCRHSPEAPSGKARRSARCPDDRALMHHLARNPDQWEEIAVRLKAVLGKLFSSRSVRGRFDLKSSDSLLHLTLYSNSSSVK
ncbi:putative acid methyltransferase [Ixodes scapularis]